MKRPNLSVLLLPLALLTSCGVGLAIPVAEAPAVGELVTRTFPAADADGNGTVAVDEWAAYCAQLTIHLQATYPEQGSEGALFNAFLPPKTP